MRKMIKKIEFRPPFIRPEISKEECRLILCKNGDNYSDKEIEEIRILMLNLAEIDYLSFNKKQKAKADEAKIIRLKEIDKPENDFKDTG